MAICKKVTDVDRDVTSTQGPLVLVTRRSPLALRQTELVREHLGGRLAGREIVTLPVVTTGDRRTSWSLEKEGGKGLFTKELEDALLSGEADLAVHSAKDLPTAMPPGLAIAGYLPRADVNDVLIMRDGCAVPEVVATSSPRRRQQAKGLFPTAVWTEIRGNVQTRLKKVAAGKVDATFLALAGLRRLGIDSFPGVTFKPLGCRQMVPAVGQAAIALQVRSERVAEFAPLLCETTAAAVTLERRFLHLLGGGCHTAAGAYFCNGKLIIFHERCGHLEVDIPATADAAAIDDILAGVIAAHGLVVDSAEGSANG